MKKIFCAIGLTLTFFSIQGQEVLTLQEAAAIALEQNFDIQISEKDVMIAVNNNTVGNAGFLPNVDLNVNKTYQNQNVELEIQGPDGIFEVNRDNAKSDRFNAIGSVNWTIFDGFGMFITKEKLQMLEEQRNLDLQVTVQNTLAAVYSAYYRIALEQDMLDVLTQTMEISKERLEFAKSRYEVGKGSKIDYLTAQVDFNTDQTNQILQQQTLESAKIDLNVLLSRQSDMPFAVEEIIEIDASLELDDMLGKVQTMNPLLQGAIKEQDIAYKSYKEAVADRYPRIGLDLSYGQGNSNNEAGQLRSSNTTGLTYGFSASWNIFNGFNRTREVQNARIIQEITAIERDALALFLEGSVHKVYINYVNNLQLMELERNNVEVALENEQIALDRYELGAGTSLDLRVAQRNAVESQNRLLDAQLTAKLAEIELLRLTGAILNGNRAVQDN